MNKKFLSIIIILFLALTIVGCTNEEEKDKNHIINNPELSPYIIIKGKTHHIFDFEDKLEKVTTFDMLLYIESLNDEKIDYELEVYNELNEFTLYKSKSPLLLPVREQVIYSNTIGGNGFKELFLKLSNNEKHYFYEEIIGTTNDEIRKHGYSDELISDEIDLSFNIIEESDRYNLEFVFNSNEDIHLDFQSFVVSKDARVYSFLGIYGYNLLDSPLKEKNNYIYKDIDIEYIYTRFVYYNKEGIKTELAARFKLEDLIKSN